MRVEYLEVPVMIFGKWSPCQCLCKPWKSCSTEMWHMVQYFLPMAPNSKTLAGPSFSGESIERWTDRTVISVSCWLGVGMAWSDAVAMLELLLLLSLLLLLLLLLSLLLLSSVFHHFVMFLILVNSVWLEWQHFCHLWLACYSKLLSNFCHLNIKGSFVRQFMACLSSAYVLQMLLVLKISRINHAYGVVFCGKQQHNESQWCSVQVSHSANFWRWSYMCTFFYPWFHRDPRKKTVRVTLIK